MAAGTDSQVGNLAAILEGNLARRHRWQQVSDLACRIGETALGEIVHADRGVTMAVDDATALARSHAHDIGVALFQLCLLYTSDAADQRSRVDLGVRRLFKKKKNLKKPLQSRRI